MKVFTLTAGLAVGYVLGARAGREKYEQIVASARKLNGHPTVVEAKDAAKGLLSTETGTTTPEPAENATSAKSVTPARSVTPAEKTTSDDKVTPAESVTPAETVTPIAVVTAVETVTPAETVTAAETVTPVEKNSSAGKPTPTPYAGTPRPNRRSSAGKAPGTAPRNN